MRVAYEWIKEVLAIDLPINAVADKLTAIGFEVESICDDCIEIAVPPNRGDCLGVMGITRELAASMNIAFVWDYADDLATHDMAMQLVCEGTAKDACPRYAACVIKELAPMVTPQWMQTRLLQAGFNLIHPLVDITNYVMLELGQPMHAYDLDKLQANTCNIRYAKEQEEFVTLKNQVLKLADTDLVIADDKQIMALAGIMGGQSTAVSGTTKHILLEAAYFSPINIRKTAKRHKIASQSGYRFERGVDAALPIKALARAVAIIKQLQANACNFSGFACCQTDSYLPRIDSIELRATRLNRLLGSKLPGEQISAILQRLGCQVSEIGNERWQVTPPQYRYDLLLEADLIEEIARIVGYEKISPLSLTGSISPKKLKIKSDNISDVVAKRGYNQVVCYSFIAQQHAEAFADVNDLISLTNPISSELAVMRPSLLPGMLKTLGYNLDRQQDTLKLFETGLCFSQQGMQQQEYLAVAACGAAFPEQWGMDKRRLDFFDIKGDVECIWQQVGHSDKLEFKKIVQHAYLHANKSAAIYHDNQFLGCIGQMHPQILALFKLSVPVYVCEIKVAPLLQLKKKTYAPISKFPSMRRDLSLIVDATCSAILLQEIVIQEIKLFDANIMVNIDVFDIYAGKNIAAGKKSIAFAVTLQHISMTLLEQTVEIIFAKLIKKLADHGANLREG